MTKWRGCVRHANPSLVPKQAAVAAPQRLLKVGRHVRSDVVVVSGLAR